MDIRLLKASEIECRVQSVKKTDNGAGCILLIYKDARVDQRLLDEVFSPMGWQRDHKELKGNIYCGIGIHNGQEWVWKWDCGSESNTEKEKGEASDSFKRAGFNWGIGRELYTAPFIWIDLDNGEYSEKDGKYYLKPKVKFEVTFISCNSDKEINRLQIKDNHHKVRYDLASPVRSQNPPQGNKPVGNNNNPPSVNQGSKNDSGKLGKPSKEMLTSLLELSKKKGVELKVFGQDNTGKKSSTEWDLLDYNKVLKALEAIK